MNILKINDVEISKRNQYLIFLSVLVLLTFFMMLCYGSSSSCSGYDFYFHYRRLHTLIDALQHGTFPMYIDYANVDGYGYFTKGFYSDVILIPFALIGLFTSTYFAYDAMIFTMTVLCGIFMYHAVRVIYKSAYAASISAILYTFAIYRLYDIYQRGALAESLSFTFLPIVFLGLFYIIKGDYKKWYILTIGYSLLIYTHAIASVLMFVTLLILLVVYCKPMLQEPKRIAYLFLAGFVTLIITSYFICPILEQFSSNSFYFDSRSPGGGAGYGKVGFDLVFWGFVSGIAYPPKLWAGVGIILISVIFLRFFIKGKNPVVLKSVDIAVIIGVFFIIATSRIFPWGRFPFSLLGFIQYPWRLYEFVSFFFAIAGGYYLSLLFVKKQQRLVVSVVIIMATLITTYIHSENFKTLYAAKALQISEGEYDATPAFANRYHTIGGEYFPTRLPHIEYIRDRGQVVESKNDDTKVSNLRREYNKTLFDADVHKPDSLILPLLYYYGYSVTLNGRELLVDQSEYGLIQVPVDESGEIIAFYKATTIQMISFYVSVITILILCIYIIRVRKKRKDEVGE